MAGVFTKPNGTCIRLSHVKGHKNKFNDVLFFEASNTTKLTRNVVFFPGDVQEYADVMICHPDYCKYDKWNLESTAELLAHRFPESHIWIVKPASMHMQTYSVFSNFVVSNQIGIPTHGDGQESWNHLQMLMESAVEKICKMQQRAKEQKLKDDDDRKFSGEGTSEFVCKVGYPARSINEKLPYISDALAISLRDLCVPLVHIPLSVVGFSKGCVVLNQLLHDITEAQRNRDMKMFLDCVDHMFWLDGGHGGMSNTWIVHDRILDKLIDSEWHFHIHVTPYQINDRFRRWIGTEHESFVRKLQARKLNFDDKTHFINEERSLENHFRVLEEF